MWVERKASEGGEGAAKSGASEHSRSKCWLCACGAGSTALLDCPEDPKNRPTVGRRKNLLWVVSTTYGRSQERPTVGPIWGSSEGGATAFGRRLLEGCESPPRSAVNFRFAVWRASPPSRGVDTKEGRPQDKLPYRGASLRRSRSKGRSLTSCA